MRRLNIKLVVSLVVGLIGIAIGMFVLNRWQVEGNVKSILADAEKKQHGGNDREAAKALSKALKQKKSEKGYQQLAEIYKRIYKDMKVEELRTVYNDLERGLNSFPDMQDVRKFAIEFNLAINQFTVALDHIKLLKDKDVASEVQTAEALLGTKKYREAATLMQKQLGYDDKQGKFIPGGPAEKMPKAYSVFVRALLMSKDPGENNAPLVDRTIAQLLSANPQNAEAIREHGLCQLMVATKNDPTHLREAYKAADQDFQSAHKMDPQDEMSLRLAIDSAVRLRELDRADQLLTTAMTQFQSKENFHVQYADVALAQGNWDDGEKRIQHSLEKFPENMDLKGQLALVKMNQKKYREMDSILAQLETAHFNPQMLLRIRGDAARNQKDYIKASKLYEELRVAILANSARQDQPTDVDLKLADCYEKLGEYDLVVPLARKTLKVDPDNLPARILMQRCRRYVGVEATETTPITAKDMAQLPDLTGTRDLQEKVSEQMAKPDARDRDFRAAEVELESYLKEQKVEPSAAIAKRAQMKLLKGEQDDARKMLLDAQNQYPKEELIWNTLFLMAMAEKKYDEARTVLYAARDQGAESYLWRVSSLQLASAEGLDAAKKALPEAEVGISKLTDEEQSQLYHQIGEFYRRLNDADNAKRCWREYAKLMPVNAMVRKELFDLALVSQDEPEMKRVTGEIGDMLGKDSALYKYCEISQILSKVSGGQENSKESLKQVDKLLEEARRTRPDWGELYRMAAWTYELRGNPSEAIDNYKAAISRGSMAGITVRRLLYLLVRMNRYPEAYDNLRYLPPADAADPIHRLAVEILMRTDHKTEAAAQAQEVSNRVPSAENYVWFANILKQSDHQGEATQVLAKAVEIQPDLAGAWVLLVSHLANDQPNKTAGERRDDAEAAVRRAKEAVKGSDAALAFGEMFELIGDLDQAEEYFKQYAKEQPDNAIVFDRLARFYLKQNKTANGEIWLDKLLESKTADETLRKSARRMKAVLLSSSGKFDDFCKACEIIRENRDPVKDSLPLDDVLVLARLYARRPEPMLMSRGANFFTHVQKVVGLSMEDHLLLALALEDTGQHQKSIDQMTSLVGRDGNNKQYVATLVKFMLDNYDEKNPADVEIDRWLGRLEEIDPEYSELSELRAWFYTLKGGTENREKAMEILARATPAQPWDAKMSAALLASARRYDVLKYYPEAESIYRAVYKLDQRANLPLGQFLALHGSMDEAMTLLEQARNAHPPMYVIQALMRALHDRPKSDLKADYYAKAEEWIREAMTQEDPAESRNGLVQLAEIRDMQSKYGEAAKLYREFLAKKDLNDLERGLAQNNLAFLIAVKPELATDPDEARQLIDAAVSALGENSDLLDTQAMVLLSGGKLEEARKYSQKATEDAPSAAKYLHLAIVQNKMGNYTAANEAYQKAKGLKFKPSDVSPLEQPMLDELLKRVSG